MVNRKWTNREINEVLQRLGESYEFPPERSAALESRIRREVIARYGRFNVSMRPAVHISEPARGGMLVFLRPVLAFAVLGVLIVGGVVVMRSISGGVRSVRSSEESAVSSVSVVAVADPVVAGSGTALSVFAVSPDAPFAVPGSQPTTGRMPRSGGRRLNPAQGVFSRWGESVFSEEGVLQNSREGKNVFPNS